jgi:hypothetical protein
MWTVEMYRAINVAIQLGDKAVPPVGSVVRTDKGAHYRVIDVAMAQSWSLSDPVFLLSDYIILLAPLRGDGHFLYLWSSKPMIVVTVPADSPPFAEWKRHR